MRILSGKGVLGLLLLALLALSSANGLELVCSQGSGRILFDQTFKAPFTIDGAFKSLAYELSKAGYEVSALTSAPITREKLQGADVFVISTRWTDFTADEISNLEDFVGSGKGLLLAGVGWSYVDYQKQPIQRFPINVLGRAFSMIVDDDIIADPTDNQGDPGNPIFHTFASHPITNRLDKVAPPKGNPSSLTLFGYSQAIISGDADAYSTYHQSVYSKGSYPPVAAANSYELGRVVLLGHEAFFTAMDRTGGLYQYDNLKLALNIFAWLSESESRVTVTSTETMPGSATGTVTVTVSAGTEAFSMVAPYLVWIVLGVALVILAFVLVILARSRRPVSQPRPKETMDEETRAW